MYVLSNSTAQTWWLPHSCWQAAVQGRVVGGALAGASYGGQAWLASVGIVHQAAVASVLIMCSWETRSALKWRALTLILNCGGSRAFAASVTAINTPATATATLHRHTVECATS